MKASRTIFELIGDSSFGEPAVQQVRSKTPRALAEKIVRLSKERVVRGSVRHISSSKTPGGSG